MDATQLIQLFTVYMQFYLTWMADHLTNFALHTYNLYAVQQIIQAVVEDGEYSSDFITWLPDALQETARHFAFVLAILLGN